MKRLIGRMTKRMHEREDGQGLAEYALILAFIAAVCVGALGALGGAIANSPGFSMF
jgi:Flp pilus assembly pilin Flp